jgi:MFS family permease
VAFASPFLGKTADRHGARRVILVCAPAFGLLIASLAFLTPALWHFYAVFIGIGIVANGATQLTYARIVSNWFDRRRGLALSLVMSGVGAGAIIMPVVVEELIQYGGWRTAYLTIGLLAVGITTPLAALVLRESPGPRAADPGPAHAPAATPSRGLRTRVAVTLLGAFFLLSLGANGCVAHLAPLLTDGGLDTQTAALATSLLGAATLGGRLLTGVLLDRFSGPRVGFVFILGSAAGMLLLASNSLGAALAAAVLLGLAIGAEADLMPYLIGRYFALEKFGEVYGYAFSAYAVAGAAGPLLMGCLFDVAGSYRSAVLAFAVTTAASALLVGQLPPYPGHGRQPGRG